MLCQTLYNGVKSPASLPKINLDRSKYSLSSRGGGSKDLAAPEVLTYDVIGSLREIILFATILKARLSHLTLLKRHDTPS
jgi:hypothetical protein